VLYTLSILDFQGDQEAKRNRGSGKGREDRGLLRLGQKILSLGIWFYREAWDLSGWQD
jgi:hypothetical protein